MLIIDTLFTAYTFMLLTRVMSSWFQGADEYPIIRFICFYTDPYLNLFRRFIPPLGMMDLSPMVAFLALNILRNVLKILVHI